MNSNSKSMKALMIESNIKKNMGLSTFQMSGKKHRFAAKAACRSRVSCFQGNPPHFSRSPPSVSPREGLVEFSSLGLQVCLIPGLDALPTPDPVARPYTPRGGTQLVDQQKVVFYQKEISDSASPLRIFRVLR